MPQLHSNFRQAATAHSLWCKLLHLNTSLIYLCRFDECVVGGESQLVDMFCAMEILRKESLEDFRVLTRVPCTFSTIDYARRSPAHLITRKPIIQVDYDDQVALSWFVMLLRDLSWLGLVSKWSGPDSHHYTENFPTLAINFDSFFAWKSRTLSP